MLYIIVYLLYPSYSFFFSNYLIPYPSYCSYFLIPPVDRFYPAISFIVPYILIYPVSHAYPTVCHVALTSCISSVSFISLISLIFPVSLIFTIFFISPVGLHSLSILCYALRSHTLVLSYRFVTSTIPNIFIYLIK